MIPKEQATSDISLFAEYISQLNPDPHCKVGGCFGRGYLGFQAVPSKDGMKVQLLTCKCSRIGETEYTRLEKKIDQGLGFLHATSSAQFEALRKRTLFGGIEYIWRKIWKRSQF